MHEQEAIFELVKKHGRTTTSLQILARNFSYFRTRDACVAYVETGGSWVASGTAIGPEEREIDAMERFAAEASKHGKRACFFAVERDLSSESSFASMHIGDQPVWDPTKWGQSLGKSLKEQLRRARAKKVTVRAATPEEIIDVDHPTRRGVNAVIAHWLEGRRMAQLGFVIDLDPFHEVHERRIFVAEREGSIVGVLIAIPIYGNNGWLIDNMLRDPSAPNGTVELLFDLALRTFAEQKCSYVTLGLSPFVGVSSPMIELIRDATGHYYNFKGLYAFKTKLRPSHWQRIYLAYPKQQRPFSAVFDAITAFLPGGWGRFWVNTVVQRAPAAALCLAAPLLPWTALLPFVDSQRWFPGTAAHAAWVATDVVMLGVLGALSRKWRRGLATFGAALGALATVAAATQLLAYNAQRASGSDWVWLGLSTVMPALATLFLWKSRGRAELYDPTRAPARVPPARPARVLAGSPARVSPRAEPLRVGAPIANREL